MVKEWLRGCNVILTVSKHWALTGRGRGIVGGSDVRTGMMRMKETHRERERRTSLLRELNGRQVCASRLISKHRRRRPADVSWPGRPPLGGQPGRRASSH